MPGTKGMGMLWFAMERESCLLTMETQQYDLHVYGGGVGTRTKTLIIVLVVLCARLDYSFETYNLDEAFTLFCSAL